MSIGSILRDPSRCLPFQSSSNFTDLEVFSPDVARNLSPVLSLGFLLYGKALKLWFMTPFSLSWKLCFWDYGFLGGLKKFRFKTPNWAATYLGRPFFAAMSVVSWPSLDDGKLLNNGEEKTHWHHTLTHIVLQNILFSCSMCRTDGREAGAEIGEQVSCYCCLVKRWQLPRKCRKLTFTASLVQRTWAYDPVFQGRGLLGKGFPP